MYTSAASINPSGIHVILMVPVQLLCNASRNPFLRFSTIIQARARSFVFLHAFLRDFMKQELYPSSLYSFLSSYLAYPTTPLFLSLTVHFYDADPVMSRHYIVDTTHRKPSRHDTPLRTTILM